jgi:hypothetical protein
MSSQLKDSVTLADLPLGSRLIIKCRKDWRYATIAKLILDTAVLQIVSPSGHTYRLRRPTSTPVCYDGEIPLLGEGSWRGNLARYDERW